MRRFRLLLATVALVAAAGCGAAAAELRLPSVSGDFGVKPAVEVPTSAPPSEPVVKVLLTGDGPAVRATDAVVANLAIWTWREGTPYLDTFGANQPTTVTLDGRNVSRTWNDALIGKRAGSRVLLVAPATVGFGADGLAPANVEPNDTLVLVFDIVGGYPRTKAFEPALALVSRTPPEKLSRRVVSAGDGAVARRGSTVVLHYTAVGWRDGKVFDSSHRRGVPNGFVLDAGAVPPGWLGALEGLRAGAVVDVAVPESLGRGVAATPGGLVVPPGTAITYRLELLDVVPRGPARRSSPGDTPVR